jgi:hypothetical protein
VEKIPRATSIPKMKNGSKHDFDSIAELLRRQDVLLEVLVDHLASVEATALLLLQMLPEESLNDVKEVKDYFLSKINDKMKAELERNLEDS